MGIKQDIWNVVKNLPKEDLVPEQQPTADPPDPPSDAVVLQIVRDLLEVEKFGGLVGIAQKNDVQTNVVKLVVKAIKLRLRKLAELED